MPASRTTVQGFLGLTDGVEVMDVEDEAELLRPSSALRRRTRSTTTPR